MMMRIKSMIAKRPGSSLDTKDRLGKVRTKRERKARNQRELTMRRWVIFMMVGSRQCWTMALYITFKEAMRKRFLVRWIESQPRSTARTSCLV
ncbi:hypothetical protein BO85DRAFT_49054 [Aspergillus piperis CBS 112811]|uniref:Uncharacterized protein n=1 Tax=Aspergillus piperis CBS 112811 TaxID=1448313 RepID=A0A8G1R0Q9_9EURO|nr:hypothetical protein BO85DRAFT_49054 [Aspergillus piperis CBS 112811]RAH56397.1 hypothetical protein BO85DRAFT_49054 [Aspergillus piperis CBS 112811]